MCIVILLLSASVRARFGPSIPSFFGSMKILSLNGEDLVYKKELLHLGNYEAAHLRRELEPRVSSGCGEVRWLLTSSCVGSDGR